MRRVAPLTIDIRPGLLGRAQAAAKRRGVGVDELVAEALEHELGTTLDAGAAPPALRCIGAFSSGRGDLGRLAGEGVFEPEPFR
jgi:hypothetical protein